VYTVAELTFAVDEIDFYCDSTFGQSRMPKPLYDIVHFGRHAPGSAVPNATRRGVAIMYTARIPTSVARALTSQAYEFRLFHEDEGDYLDYFAKGALRSKANAAKLATLPKYKFYQFFKEGGQPMKLYGGIRK
jgi:hypothetical protein